LGNSANRLLLARSTLTATHAQHRAITIRATAIQVRRLSRSIRSAGVDPVFFGGERR
jgi:hypothetical protein